MFPLPLGTRIRITNGALTLWGETGYLIEIEEDGEHGHILLDSGPTIRVATKCFKTIDSESAS